MHMYTYRHSSCHLSSSKQTQPSPLQENDGVSSNTLNSGWHTNGGNALVPTVSSILGAQSYFWEPLSMPVMSSSGQHSENAFPSALFSNHLVKTSMSFLIILSVPLAFSFSYWWLGAGIKHVGGLSMMLLKHCCLFLSLQETGITST